MKPSKKQSDKAFIEKLKTINIGGSHGKSTEESLREIVQNIPPLPCPDCGQEMKCVGAAIVEVDRPKSKKKESEEASFAA